MFENKLFMAFDPCYDASSRLLILGSFPSVISRKENFYYANPLNRFWRTLAALADEPVPTDVCGKKDFLFRHNIALWDVVKECRIKGSLDQNITDYTVQDIPSLLKKAPEIELIALNGGTAYRFFKKAFPQYADVVRLPSTSPANTRFDAAEWEKSIGKFFKKQSV